MGSNDHPWAFLGEMDKVGVLKGGDLMEWLLVLEG